jgi:hypothetical protein
MRKSKHPAAPARALGKDRGFFNQHVSFPMRDASPVELERFWADATRVDTEISPEHHWDCLGPYNIAGRVTALVIHPENPEHWVAGSAAGGVWSTSDAGVSWSQTWSRFAPQSIGALAWAKCFGVWALIAATGSRHVAGHAEAGRPRSTAGSCMAWPAPSTVIGLRGSRAVSGAPTEQSPGWQRIDRTARRPRLRGSARRRGRRLRRPERDAVGRLHRR